ncbi:MAG: 6-phosphogluconolactonase [Hyphomonadaceae bacterium]|nr:6-phosphogluconolactonase [Hyphomonadaceae bacterium]
MIRDFATRGTLMQAAAEAIANALNKGISARGEGVAALSGGSTPEPAYEALAALPVDWKRVTFLLVDERFVPTSDPASNEAMLRRALARPLGEGAKLLPMYSHGGSAHEAAHRADALYAGKHIDVALIGMGADGHTASWFPQSEQLGDALDTINPRTVISVEAPGATGSAERLTLTRSALARAGAIALLITGDEKRRVLEDKMRAPLPVDALFDLPTAADVLWAP